MRRTFATVVMLLVVAGSARIASAVFFDDAANYSKRTYHMNSMWPWPLQCADRVAVYEPFCIMINNGWRRQNLLGAHHFHPATNQLTTAGELRVQWIMTQAPPDRRSIFVERTLNEATNADRVAAVRNYAMQLAITDQQPNVEETHLISEGRPASVVDATNVKFMQAMPAPVLPPVPGTQTSSP
ncbi:MAG: hypothetical protein IT425_04160 [Pirellulales bacterium]|nr:hypothetical protein [Pirellulales bacterium]